jgi:site-specific recombinase XerD
MVTSFKVKFRASTVEGKEGSVYYQVIHNRTVRQISTAYRLFTWEWDSEAGKVITHQGTEERTSLLKSVAEGIRCDMQRLRQVADTLAASPSGYTADEVVAAFHARRTDASLQNFMQQCIAKLIRMGRTGTANGYKSTLNSFMRFRKGQDIMLNAIDSDVIQLYEAHLRLTNVARNSSSFYMRNLRTVYNMAIEQQLTPQRTPFAHVYTGIDKTVKRALSISQIRQLKNADLTDNPAQALARDMFMFSFYTRGMALADMANLTTANLRNGYLVYRRQKPRQELHVKWEPCMQEIVDRYPRQSPFLLPLIKSEEDKRDQYKLTQQRVNHNLKKLSERLGLPHPLTMSMARHSWASIANSKDIALSVIGEGLGYNSENATRIYLAQIDTSQVDRANKKILNEL